MKKVDGVASTADSPLTRGKYANLLERGSNIAVLDPDVVDYFPDSESVNNALRAFLAFGKEFESVKGLQKRPSSQVAVSRHKPVFDPRRGRRPEKLAAAR